MATAADQPLTLYVANKNYSSWSLRAYLVLCRVGVPFEEVVIPLDQPETRAAIAAHSPSGRLPALRHGDRLVWDSLAISEYLAETFPQAQLWPQDAGARAIARSISAEMHSGFGALRQHMPMNMRARHPGRGRGPGVAEDLARIQRIWVDLRAQNNEKGEFLFGPFCIADAMFAPVVSRLITYHVEVEPLAAQYMESIGALPGMRDWTAAAQRESWVVPSDEIDFLPAPPAH